MKRKGFKTLAMAVAAVVLTTTMSACNSKPSDDSKNSDGGGDTLNITCVTADFGVSVTGTEIQNEWLRMMEEHLGKKLNIKFEYINYSDYKEKLQVLIAGGNMPDILTFSHLPAADVIKYGEKGIFEEVTPYLDQMPNYKSAIDKDPTAKTSIYSTEGKLYGVYNALYVPSSTATVAGQSAVRNRVLKENNLKVPSTLDEMYEVALALKEKGISKYPIALHEEWQPPENTILKAYHTSSSLFFDGEKYTYGPLTEDYRDALKYMNKIYSAGLIAPDYFSHTVDNGNKALSDGSAIIIPSVWEGYPAQWSVDYPTEEWVLVPQMTSDKYPDTPWMFYNEVKYEWQMNSGYSIVVNSKSKNKEDIFKLLDYQYSPEMMDLLNWGIKDKSYKVNADGQKEFLLSGQANREAIVKMGLPLSGTCRAGIFPQPQDMELWRVASADPSPISWEGEIITEKLVPFSAARMNEKNTSPYEYQPNIVLTSDENEQYSLIMSPVETYVKEEKVKFIKGERSFDEWDKYVEEVKKMGDIDAAMNIRNSKIGK